MYARGPASTWKYDGSRSIGGSFYLAAEGGVLAFSSPDDAKMSLTYATVGGSLGVGVKMPNFSVSGDMTPSGGKLYKSETFDGELERSDLTGPCLLFEVGAGVGAGVSGTIMVFGLSRARTAFKLVNVLYGEFAIWGEVVDDLGLLDDALDMNVNAILFAGGMTVGAQAGGGVTGYGGYVW
jgi:hypothetical protein